ncbi:hypothetical protein M514_25355 [Trichuris suis]|uniref:Uncharacterized protein n=1 Tax=Trichuris suis TaxID=68888 RepID=A0A085MZ59_9BILA|nr:hypothetical protein M514_25355 [Trichuris suis]
MLYPGVTTESSGPAESIQHLYQEIAGLEHQVGLGGINEEDITELLESHDEELSNSDLLEIERQLTEDQEAPEPRNPEQAKTLSTKDLSEAFRLLENAMAIFTEKDPQQERNAQVNRMITDAHSCYREIYR